MNLISNTCIGAALYKEMNEPYGNPFCWNVISFDSLYSLILNYETINFWNFEIKKDNNWNFRIEIDNKIVVNYVHYKFSKEYPTLTKVNVDKFWNKIWEYIVAKYEERLARMIEKNEEPIFIVGSIHRQHLYTENEIKKICELCIKKKYKLVVINNFNFSEEFPNIKFITTDKTDKEINNITFAKEIYPQIKEYINEKSL